MKKFISIAAAMCLLASGTTAYAQGAMGKAAEKAAREKARDDREKDGTYTGKAAKVEGKQYGKNRKQVV